jgi:hypothetical protein
VHVKFTKRIPSRAPTQTGRLAAVQPVVGPVTIQATVPRGLGLLFAPGASARHC